MGGLLTVVFGAFPACRCHALVGGEQGTGCYVPPEDARGYFARMNQANAFRFGTEYIEPRSGNPTLDRAFAQTLGRLARMFDVLPGFGYYRDGNQPNALATPQPLLQRTDGTVLFGLGMLQNLMRRPEHPDASVVAVCAHEFGHIVSYKRGLIQQLAPNRQNPFRAEQFADYLSGYYAGARKRERSTFPAVVFATTMHSFGGPVRGTHGTGAERGEATLEGFKASFERNVSANEAIQLGFQYAMSR